MQSDRHFPQNTGLPLADQVGNGYIPNPPVASFFGQNVDFQPSNICPRNFIIFDRTDNHSQIMYNPSTPLGFSYPGPNVLVGAPYVQERNDKNNLGEVMKEDSADIDALLSFEEEDEDEDEEEVSTARTQWNDASDTADSCASRARKGKLTLSSSSRKSKVKREKMRKMVDSLRGMVPGGNRMSTVGVLDEAVKYLKSLKVEVQKIGVGNFKN